jgi:zinc transporter
MTMNRADTAHATPESGIVWIYHFEPDGTAKLFPNENVEPALADHVGWTWVDLSLTDARCRAWVAQNARLSELAREILLDEIAAKVTEITSRRLFTLSVLTACLLPPTLVTGFFGMNTEGLQLRETAGGTWIATALLVASSAASYWVLRRMRAF